MLRRPIFSDGFVRRNLLSYFTTPDYKPLWLTSSNQYAGSATNFNVKPLHYVPNGAKQPIKYLDKYWLQGEGTYWGRPYPNVWRGTAGDFVFPADFQPSTQYLTGVFSWLDRFDINSWDGADIRLNMNSVCPAAGDNNLFGCGNFLDGTGLPAYYGLILELTNWSSVQQARPYVQSIIPQFLSTNPDVWNPEVLVGVPCMGFMLCKMGVSSEFYWFRPNGVYAHTTVATFPNTNVGLPVNPLVVVGQSYVLDAGYPEGGQGLLGLNPYMYIGPGGMVYGNRWPTLPEMLSMNAAFNQGIGIQ